MPVQFISIWHWTFSLFQTLRYCRQLLPSGWKQIQKKKIFWDEQAWWTDTEILSILNAQVSELNISNNKWMKKFIYSTRVEIMAEIFPV